MQGDPMRAQQFYSQSQTSSPYPPAMPPAQGAQPNPYASNPFASSSQSSHGAPPSPSQPMVFSPTPQEATPLPPYPPNGYCQSPQGFSAVPGSKCIVKLPKPRYKGGTQFFGNIPMKSSTFAWSEICATPEPEASLAPVPQVPMKQWYNTYMYVPEKASHRERQFLERYVQGPDGEWLDIVKARRMSNFYEEQRMQEMKERMERAMITTGTAVQQTQYTDAYSGEHLVSCGGELLPKQVLYDEYNIHSRSADMREMLERTKEDMDFDNLRVAWPFGAPHRNKKISPHTYEWFDRRNVSIPSDKAFEIVEMPSSYVDRETYNLLYAGGLRAHGPAVMANR